MMDQLVWNAARRLALLVGCALAMIGVLFARDAIARHHALVADLSAGAAALLAITALGALVRANRFFARPEEAPSVRMNPYRYDTRTATRDPFGVERARATRNAAAALIALALGGAFVVVALASR